MQIAGFGINIEEIPYIILFAFFVWVAIVSARDNDWNIPNTIYREFNNLFFNGVSLTNSCSNFFEGLFTPIKLIGTTGDFVSSIIGGVVNTLATLINYLFGVLLLLYRLLVGCSMDILKLALGWTLVLFTLVKTAGFIKNLRDLIHGY